MANKVGDMVDRGHYSRRNLRTVRELAEADPEGRLKLLLGNHESMSRLLITLITLKIL